VISDTTRYHEAGHAVGSLKLGIGLDDPGIEINSDEEACTHIRISDAQSLKDADHCICRAATKLSGPAAQLRFENRPFTAQELEKDHRTFQDLNEAKLILQQYWTSRGERNDKPFYRQLADAGTIAHNLVEIHWSEVEAIVAATKETGCVSAERTRSIVGSPKSLTDYLRPT
jgi:hypothetical protein